MSASKPPLKIVSGGQSGVDRAALDAAIAIGFDDGGRCPSGGWAEDLTTPHGLLGRYPALKETLSPDPTQRTQQPSPDGLVADLQPALCQQILDISVAQVKRRYSQTACRITSGGKRWRA